MRLERRPEKTCRKNPLGKKTKQEIWVGTMAQAPAIGSLSYGGFTKVKTDDSAVKIPEKLNYKKLNGALNRVDSEA